MSESANVRKGALLVLGAALAFSILAALVKSMAATLGNEMLVWARNTFAALFLLPWFVRYRPGRLLTRHWRGHLLRGAAGLCAMYCMFWSIPRMNLAEALLLNLTATLFIPFIAWMWLKERFSLHTGIAIAIGFVGIVLVLRPGPGLFTWVALVGLASGIFAAFAMVSIRSMAGVEPTTRIVLYFSVLGALASSVPLTWAWQSPTALQWLALATVGLLAMIGQLLMTRAYMIAPAAQVGPFTYASVVFAALIGWLFWGESLEPTTWAGIGFVAAGGALVAFGFPRPRAT